MKKINLKTLAGKFHAYRNSIAAKNVEWEGKHRDAIDELLNDLPHGSGIDSGVQFDWDKSTPERLIFTFGFHHMNDNGYYDGWTSHSLIITPSLYFGFQVRITGRNRNDIKTYLGDLFMETFTI